MSTVTLNDGSTVEYYDGREDDPTPKKVKALQKTVRGKIIQAVVPFEQTRLDVQKRNFESLQQDTVDYYESKIATQNKLIDDALDKNLQLTEELETLRTECTECTELKSQILHLEVVTGYHKLRGYLIMKLMNINMSNPATSLIVGFLVVFWSLVMALVVTTTLGII